MEARIVSAGDFDVVGITTRTANRDEMGPAGRIAKLWGEFYSSRVADRIPNRADGSLTVVYSDYESDKDGAYTYMIGARVTSVGAIPDGMSVKRVPLGKYAAFTSARGPLVQVVQNAWKLIWTLKKDQPGGDRSYNVDYEVYDERSRDPANAQIDLYIGVK